MQTDATIEPFALEPLLEVMNPVDTPIPLATIVEHARLIVPGPLESGIVGFERWPDGVTGQAPMLLDDRCERGAVGAPDRVAQLDCNSHLLLERTAFEKHRMRAPDAIVRWGFGVTRKAQPIALSQYHRIVDRMTQQHLRRRIGCCRGRRHRNDLDVEGISAGQARCDL